MAAVTQMPATERRRVEVAAAVIVNSEGQFLLAQRPPGKVYAGYWEFPGGKVEPGETAAAAMARELHEELGIDVSTAYPWLTRDYDYEHAAVRLRFFRVTAWRGEPHGREQQHFAWQSITDITVAPLLPANGPILRALELPPVYGITPLATMERGEFSRRLALALGSGLRLLQVREKQLPGRELLELTRAITATAHGFGARVLVNGPGSIALAAQADGVHWTAVELMTAKLRPHEGWCAASCHDALELARAQVLGVDFVVLGPVCETPTHADAAPLGWTEFARLIRDYPLPVYALGGMRAEDLTTAWRHGAHGIAMLRGAWPA
jgi:8-oxo-dGTP diphosphatase